MPSPMSHEQHYQQNIWNTWKRENSTDIPPSSHFHACSKIAVDTLKGWKAVWSRSLLLLPCCIPLPCASLAPIFLQTRHVAEMKSSFASTTTATMKRALHGDYRAETRLCCLHPQGWERWCWWASGGAVSKWLIHAGLLVWVDVLNAPCIKKKSSKWRNSLVVNSFESGKLFITVVWSFWSQSSSYFGFQWWQDGALST